MWRLLKKSKLHNTVSKEKCNAECKLCHKMLTKERKYNTGGVYGYAIQDFIQELVARNEMLR